MQPPDRSLLRLLPRHSHELHARRWSVVGTLLALALVLLSGCVLVPFAPAAQEPAATLQIEKAPDDRAAILGLTQACIPTERPANAFPTAVVGISTVYPLNSTYYDRLKDLGVHWTRSEFIWQQIEKEPHGVYDWSTADAMVADHQKNGLSLLGDINYIPTYLQTWAEARDHFRTFMTALVDRYRPGGVLARQKGWPTYGVTHWQVFNEPNLTTSTGWMEGRPPAEYVGEYAGLLAVANAAIRAQDRSAVIVLGGLSPDDVTGMPYGKFFAAFYSYRTAPCFDVVGFHPYGRSGRFRQTADEIRGLVKKNGDKDKPVWFDEYGTNTESQLKGAVEAMFHERDAVAVWFYFTLRDFGPTLALQHYGLVNYDFQPKAPVYNTFKSGLAQSGWSG